MQRGGWAFRAACSVGGMGVVLGVGGCVPATFTQVPEIRGRVVDERGAAVRGAVVEVSSQRDGRVVAWLESDGAGRVFRGEEAVWSVYIVPMDNFGESFEVVARGGGRESATRPIRRAWARVRLLGLGGTERVDLGALRLDRGTMRP